MTTLLVPLLLALLSADESNGDDAPPARRARAPRLAVISSAIPVETLLEDAGPQDRVHIVVVPPAQPEHAEVAPQLGKAIRAAVRKNIRIAAAELVPDEEVSGEASDAEIVQAEQDQGASIVLVARIYPGDGEGKPPRVLFSTYTDPAAPDVTQMSASVVVPKQRDVEKGMARILSDASEDDDTRAREEDDAASRRRMAAFRKRALTVQRVDAEETESGLDEYRIVRNGEEVSEEELDRLGVADVDPVTTVDAPGWDGARILRGWPALGLLGFPLGCGAIGLTVCGGSCSLCALYGLSTGQWTGFQAVFNTLWYIGFGALFSIPAAALGLIPGLLSALVGAARVHAGGAAPPHPYLLAITKENQRIARELGIPTRQLGERYAPAR